MNERLDHNVVNEDKVSKVLASERMDRKEVIEDIQDYMKGRHEIDWQKLG